MPLDQPAADTAPPEKRRETRALSEEKRAMAIELFKHGIGYMKASRILNISANTLRDWSREFKKGTFKAKVSNNQYRYPQSVRENVIRMRLSGYSWSEIYKQTGIASSTARKWIDAYCCSNGRRKQLLVVSEDRSDEERDHQIH